jgi:hypothetical protein
MHILEFDCIVCSPIDKKPRRMGLKKADHNAAANEWIAQCFGCGNFCGQTVDDTRIELLAL